MKRSLKLNKVTSAEFSHAFLRARLLNRNVANFTCPLPAGGIRFSDCYLTDDKKSGYSVADNGEICNLFSLIKGRGKDLMLHAIQEGEGVLTFNFDGYLTTLYESFGFKVYDRAPWDETLAPEDWDYQSFGTPDVVWMKLEGRD
jgi:hypothetical protein